jgi:hypothetical protein
MFAKKPPPALHKPKQTGKLKPAVVEDANPQKVPHTIGNPTHWMTVALFMHVPSFFFALDKQSSFLHGFNPSASMNMIGLFLVYIQKFIPPIRPTGSTFIYLPILGL